MGVTVNTSGLKKLEDGLRHYESILPKSVASQALRRSAKPMQLSAKKFVPVGDVVSADGWGKNRGLKYARGGTTRRDVRLKMVTPENQEVTRAIVGVSKLPSKVGWRTKFITNGFKDRAGRIHKGRNFLKSAYDETIDFVRTSFSKEVLLSFQRWAKRSLPQGRF